MPADSIRVSNTSGNANQPSAIRVYKDDIMIAEVFPTRRNPLQYIKDYPRSKYRKELIDQLVKAGLSGREINKILE